MIMANTLPMIAIQIGNLELKFNARKSPVRAALPSLTVRGSPIAFCHMYSERTHDAIHTTISTKARIPKLKIPNRAAGARARSTSYMMDFVEVLLRTCGDDEIFNKLLTMLHLLFLSSLGCHILACLLKGLCQRTFCRTYKGTASTLITLHTV